jgi:hypothetical protein
VDDFATMLDGMTTSDWVGTASYTILAASYLVTNMYWLRILAIVALTSEAAYFYLVGDRELWVGILWAAVFNVINIVQLIILARARWRVRLSEEERALYATAFGRLDAVNFHRLLRAGAWREFAQQTELTRQGEPVTHVHLLVRGNAVVHVDGSLVAGLGTGAFIGEMAFLGDGRASADVLALPGSRCFSIEVEKLRRLIGKHDEIGASVAQQFAIDLARKLRVAGARA